MRSQQLAVDTRLVIKALQKRFARKLHEVLKSRAIRRQQREMKARLALRSAALFKPASRRYIRLVADNRIDPLVAARRIKLERTIQVAMIRNRQRVHPQLFGPIDQRIDRAGSIQKTVMTMAMQMRKRRRRHGDSFIPKTHSLISEPGRPRPREKILDRTSFYRFATALATSLRRLLVSPKLVHFN